MSNADYRLPPPPDVVAGEGASTSPPTFPAEPHIRSSSQPQPSEAPEQDTPSAASQASQDNPSTSTDPPSGGRRCEVLHRVLFVLKDKPGASPYMEDDRCELVEYPYEVIDSERAQFLLRKAGVVEIMFPKGFWQSGASVPSMQQAYHAAAAKGIAASVSPHQGASTGQLSASAAPSALGGPAASRPSDFVYCTYTVRPAHGCDHYTSHFTFHCALCEKEGLPADYPCKRCHDDAVFTHELDPGSVSKVTCVTCGTSYPFGEDFRGCPNCAGESAPPPYICRKCLIIAENFGPHNPVHHCEKCGHCVRGAAGITTRHCDACNRCYGLYSFDSHNCIPQVGGCIFCLDALDSTAASYHLMGCGSHYAHDHCLSAYLASGKATRRRALAFICPVCQRALFKAHDTRLHGSSAFHASPPTAQNFCDSASESPISRSPGEEPRTSNPLTTQH